ncbi:glycosyltransferase family 2 protein [Frigidibacter sp. MR17.24]|uniref:glycosyltransferase family 2 protein n=1 Tax=Frigidibacter sp. MR17.24 TaxID=3127345 RepID=UPI003012EB44
MRDLEAALRDMRHRGAVPPVPTAAARPLWSVMIPVFNGASDLAQSLGSVLAQDPGPEIMQIEVVDDCSTADDPEAVVRALAGDRVAFYRQPVNGGHARNFNSCIARSRGRLVHILHADDWVGTGFYQHMQDLLAASPEAVMGFCRHTIVGPDGQTQHVSPLEVEKPGPIPGWLERISGQLRLQPPSVVVRRDVYEDVGGFDTRMKSCGEDWEMWVRLAVLGPVVFEPTPLAFYRDAPASLTKRSVRSGQNIRDVRRATDIVAGYLPGPTAPALVRRARFSWAEWALYWAWQQVEAGDLRAGFTALRQAVLCSQDPSVLGRAARIATIGARRRLRHVWAKPNV